MRRKAAAVSPSSSLECRSTLWSTSPSAMPSAALSSWRMPPTSERLSRYASSTATSTAVAPSPDMNQYEELRVELKLAVACALTLPM